MAGLRYGGPSDFRTSSLSASLRAGRARSFCKNCCPLLPAGWRLSTPSQI